MAFTVETGSGDPSANSLVSVAYFVQYCTDRGYIVQAAWAALRIQVSLVKATDFLNFKYGRRFSGVPMNPYQACAFPRNLCWMRLADGGDAWNGWGIPPRNRVLVVPGTIPDKIMQAVCELALVADSDDLSPIVSAEDFNTVAEKIGPIEVEYNRKRKLPADIVTKAGYLVAPFIVTGGSQVSLVRG